MVRLKQFKTQVLFVIIILPVVAIAIWAFFNAKHDLTELVYSRRQGLSQVAAIAVKEKLDRLKDVGVSLASRVRFQEHVEKSEWKKAIEVMKKVQEYFPFVVRIFLVDREGNLKADLDSAFKNSSQNFFFQEWFQGVSQNWEPYISGTLQSYTDPKISVVAGGFPIINSFGEVSGVLVLQVDPSQYFASLKTIDVGDGGVIYVVDNNGNLALHPQRINGSSPIDYMIVPVVQKVLNGNSGLEISHDPLDKEDRLSAFAPVSTYGWGVVVEQPVAKAFAVHDRNLRVLALSFALVIVITGTVAFYTMKASSQLILEQVSRLEAEKGNRLRDDFISIAAHELKTPLTALKLQLQFTPMIVQNSEFKGKVEFLNLFQKSLKQLDQFAGLADELLDVSRIGSGQLKLNPKFCNLSDLVGLIVEQLKFEILDANCKITLALAPSVLGKWDAIRIEQVVRNLLSNALKFGQGKEIQISTKIVEQTAVLVVQDQGIGISLVDQAKLFNRFQRVESVAKYRGLGLGLFISSQIIKAHGGSVSVESELGHGASFTVKLPLKISKVDFVKPKLTHLET